MIHRFGIFAVTGRLFQEGRSTYPRDAILRANRSVWPKLELRDVSDPSSIACAESLNLSVTA